VTSTGLTGGEESALSVSPVGFQEVLGLIRRGGGPAREEQFVEKGGQAMDPEHPPYCPACPREGSNQACTRGCRSDASSPSSFVLPSDELVDVEELRQEEVPDDHEHDQTQGNNNTSESLTGCDHRSNDHRRDQADRKPDRRILHVAEHELTLARRTSVRSAAARDHHGDFTQRTQPRSHHRDPPTTFLIPRKKGTKWASHAGARDKLEHVKRRTPV
jgi:hypothetical protein